MMETIRHPELAEDIREAAFYYAEISERVMSSFWNELDAVLQAIKENPLGQHFDRSGLRRVNFRRFPYHLLYAVDDQRVFLVVLRHNRRHPAHGLERLS